MSSKRSREEEVEIRRVRPASLAPATQTQVVIGFLDPRRKFCRMPDTMNVSFVCLDQLYRIVPTPMLQPIFATDDTCMVMYSNEDDAKAATKHLATQV